MKKAELSMSVIIGAAIALLILVLLSVLVLRSGNTLVEGTGCGGIEGSICVPDNELCSDYNIDGDRYVQSQRSCTVSEDKCCVPFGS